MKHQNEFDWRHRRIMCNHICNYVRVWKREREIGVCVYVQVLREWLRRYWLSALLVSLNKKQKKKTVFVAVVGGIKAKFIFVTILNDCQALLNECAVSFANKNVFFCVCRCVDMCGRSLSLRYIQCSSVWNLFNCFLGFWFWFWFWSVCCIDCCNFVLTERVNYSPIRIYADYIKNV